MKKEKERFDSRGNDNATSRLANISVTACTSIHRRIKPRVHSGELFNRGSFARIVASLSVRFCEMYISVLSLPGRSNRVTLACQLVVFILPRWLSNHKVELIGPTSMRNGEKIVSSSLSLLHFTRSTRNLSKMSTSNL